MTTEEDPPQTPEDDGPAPEFDPLLRLTVAIFNRLDGSGMGITLSVKGQLVSGILVSTREYYEGMAEEFRQASGQGGLNEVLAEQFDQIATMAKEDQEKVPPPLAFHIHLKEARILSGGQLVPKNRPVWWRGRISQVDGFSLGVLRED